MEHAPGFENIRNRNSILLKAIISRLCKEVEVVSFNCHLKAMDFERISNFNLVIARVICCLCLMCTYIQGKTIYKLSKNPTSDSKSSFLGFSKKSRSCMILPHGEMNHNLGMTV